MKRDSPKWPPSARIRAPWNEVRSRSLRNRPDRYQRQRRRYAPKPSPDGRHAFRVETRRQLAVVSFAAARDDALMNINRHGFGQLRCPKQLSVLPGVGPSFDEPGALAPEGSRDADWFSTQLQQI